ncbi:hypothetical protein LTR49_027949 [Elasticomyces elasticus]|nr:hypothetical protein LTR49_027949 [Elasticomyces elasticus]
MFHDKCWKKYLTKSSKLSTGELSFLTSTKPMNMDKIIHLLTANLSSYGILSQAENTLANQVRKLKTNVAMKTHTIKSMFENIYPIRSRLTEMLMATDLSTFCYTFDIELTDKEKDYYLRPIRDLVDQEERIKSEVVKGTKISIVGTDLPLWIMRIKEPTKYWGTFKECVTIRVWILAKMGDEEREKSENIVRSIELEIAEIRHAIMNSSEDWNVDTDLYDDVCTTLIRSLESYQERMTYTLRPLGKFMLLSSSSSLSEIETSFGSMLFEDSTYEWHLYSGTTHSSIDMLYARINIEWPAYAGPS